MSSIAFVAPVKDIDAARSFAREVSGQRKAEYLESRKRLDVTKERIFLGQSPMGAMILGYSEGINPGFRMAQVAVSQNAFDKFYLASVIKMSGADFTKMPAGPPPHLAFEWTNGKHGKAATMMAAPVPDAAKFWQLCREMSQRYAEHSESRARHGITLERAFLMHDAKMAVVYIEGDDPVAAMERSMASTAGYDKWFTQEISRVHGIDFAAAKPPPPEPLFAFDA